MSLKAKKKHILVKPIIVNCHLSEYIISYLEHK
jgi:hypothetical protein